MLFDFFILPLLIFLARVTDVSMDTVRIIFVSKGLKKIAPIIGFFQALIWIFTLTRIVQNMENWMSYIAYAGGFATGNYVGILLEEKLAVGFEMVRVITKKEADDLIHSLRDKGYGITWVPARGAQGEVGIIYIIVKRSKLKEVLPEIKKYNPNALYTIEDIRFVNKEIFFLETNQKRKFLRSRRI